uniref:Uncharacterized protein n=1 Tax=Oryza brachyantha TaxID=4533 RepID=J3M6U1_ORYBR
MVLATDRGWTSGLWQWFRAKNRDSVTNASHGMVYCMKLSFSYWFLLTSDYKKHKRMKKYFNHLV